MHPTTLAAAPGRTTPAATGSPEPVVLDWSKHWMRDETGRPCHKVCAETAEQARRNDTAPAEVPA
jgi:hypothetical protein